MNIVDIASATGDLVAAFLARDGGSDDARFHGLNPC
jgi:hypothetical protein